MMNKIIVFLLISFTPIIANAQNISVKNLTCEYKINPLGIDQPTPALGWQLQSIQQGICQIAYRVLVADDSLLLQKNIGNTWDSKKIEGSESIQVIYKGKPLQSAKKYYWKVMVWDNQKNVSEWSGTAFWQMGLLNETAWNGAKWIGYQQLPDSLKIITGFPDRGPKNLTPVKDTMSLLRKNFSVDKAIKTATMFICGLGQFELSINGKKVGDHFLDPAWTQFDKEAMYVSFDVTGDVSMGNNAIGVMLGNGFQLTPRTRYRKFTNAIGYPKMICRLMIEYADGSVQSIVSDKSWKATRSPITYSSIFGGEDYDARLEQNGWNTSLFDDSSWRQVLEVDGTNHLHSQLSEPIKFFETFSPVKTTRIKDSIHVFDLGQNASGIPSITLKGKRGDTIKIIPAELINSNGTVNQKATGNPYYYLYILKSNSAETWQPRFTYYGFRYLQVEGAVPGGESNIKNLPIVLAVKGLHMRNAAAIVGSFSSSSDLFNKTNDLINWSIKSNLQSVLTDCPHREKLGWLEQVHLMGSSIRYNFDVVNLLKKTVYDMMQSQTATGLIPEIAPEYVKFDWGGEMFRDSPEWGSTGIILPWYLYQWYGEKDLLLKAYPMMKRYIEYLKTKANDHILTQGLGDWYDLGPKDPGVSQLTTRGVTATAIYYYDLGIVSKVADMLGEKLEANEYSLLAKKVKVSFNKAFFHQGTKQYATGSQTSNAMAVYMGLVDPVNKKAVIDNIVKDLRANNNALTAGDIGYRYLLRVLEAAGRSDVIFDMNNRSDVPGYGYQLAKGATALTESWQALSTVSNNHLMLGHLMEWFYSGLAGIRQDEKAVAFKKIIIHPDPVGNISAAKTSYLSPYGLISTAWKKNSHLFELNVEVPANTSATIYLPANKKSTITVNGQTLPNNGNATLSKYEDGRAIIFAGSGIYSFKVQSK
ncbi:MAG: Bacterial alpha-L-rhamnosidase [Ferruginibacter sp.]|nr:Bacterial alpha-L-rhamnosidase [Ferruginibacter sp.]